MADHMISDEYISISSLQHYAYCPRQFALIHIEQHWLDNYLTADGSRLHDRVDSGVNEQRNDIRYERAVLLRSDAFGIHGKADLLEIRRGDPPRYFPVEYKRGSIKVGDWDRIQLCAQALCIEEMKDVSIDMGAIWYWKLHTREEVPITQVLRNRTIDVIDSIRTLWSTMETPPPINDKRRCLACSLKDACRPDLFSKDRSLHYLNGLFVDEENP